MNPQLRKFFKEIGKLGGRITAERLTPVERKERAQRAAKARWGKTKRTKKS